MLECTWPNQCTKNILQNLFEFIHLVRTYVTTDFSTPLSMYAAASILDVPPPFPKLRAYLIDGLFLKRKISNNIRISCSVKKKFEKTNKFLKSSTHPKIFHINVINNFNSYLSQCF